MKIEEYLEQAPLTSSNMRWVSVGLGSNDISEYTSAHAEMFHAMLGFVTEAGEIADAWKKALAYGRPLDTINLDEEVGDLMWYVALYCKARADSLVAKSVTPYDILRSMMQKNITKLRVRYPNKFTAHDAAHRDTAAERRVLEE